MGGQKNASVKYFANIPLGIALVLIVFAPITSLTPNFCSRCGCKPSVYGALSSITVPISLVAINVLMLFFGS